MNIIKERRHRVISALAMLRIKLSAHSIEIVLSRILGRIRVNRSVFSAAATTTTASSRGSSATTASATGTLTRPA
jgi:hypothetical protein